MEYREIRFDQDGAVGTLTLDNAGKINALSIRMVGEITHRLEQLADDDHLKVLIAAKAAGIDNVRAIKYIAFQGGGEAVTQLVGGHVQAFTGDISEALGFMESGDLRVLAVLSPERLPGKLSDIPTAKEQGVDAVGANWRGFYAPGGMSDDAYAYWSQALVDLYASDEWKKVMTDNGLMPFGLSGAQLTEFVDKQVADIQTISREIGLIK